MDDSVFRLVIDVGVFSDDFEISEVVVTSKERVRRSYEDFKLRNQIGRTEDRFSFDVFFGSLGLSSRMRLSSVRLTE